VKTKKPKINIPGMTLVKKPEFKMSEKIGIHGFKAI